MKMPTIADVSATRIFASPPRSGMAAAAWTVMGRTEGHAGLPGDLLFAARPEQTVEHADRLCDAAEIARIGSLPQRSEDERHRSIPESTA
jgi:hypothetical protein